MASVSGEGYEVKLTGAIFTGAIYGQMKTCIREIEEDVADDVQHTIRAIDDVTFRHPTGHARSKVTSERKGDRLVVDRGGLVYGPWLEDGGSRRRIFKGYGAFKKAAREVDKRVPQHIAANLERHVIGPNR
jgi:hypothetical protein